MISAEFIFLIQLYNENMKIYPYSEYASKYNEYNKDHNKKNDEISDIFNQ